MAMQMNWLLDAGGFTVNDAGKFAVDFTKIKDGVTSLTREIMTLQATGNYAGTKALLDRMVVIRPEVKRLLDGLENVPVDIEPKFTTELGL